MTPCLEQGYQKKVTFRTQGDDGHLFFRSENMLCFTVWTIPRQGLHFCGIHPTVGVAVDGLTNDVSVRFRSSREQLWASH